MALQPIQRRAITDDVFEQLTQEILSGGFIAGRALPSERDLAVALGVNRGAVREAMRRLEQAGLVDSRPGSGTHVRDFKNSAGLELLPHLLFRSDGDVDPLTVRSVLEMRSALGPDVARAAALRRTDADLVRLRALTAAHGAAEADLSQQQALAIAYWDALVDSSRNIAYRLAYNSLRQVYELVRDALQQVLEDEIRDAVRLQQLTRAVAEGDAVTAGEVARALCERGRRNVERAFAALDFDELSGPTAGLDADIARPSTDSITDGAVSAEEVDR